MSGITEPFSHWTLLHGTPAKHVNDGATVPWNDGLAVIQGWEREGHHTPCFGP